MTATQLTDDAVPFELVATCAAASLATEPLMQHFGLTRREAEAVLMAGGGLVVPRLGVERARAALPLLAALGLRARMRDADNVCADEGVDLSVRLDDPAVLAEVIATLARHGFGQVTSADAFQGASGLVLAGLGIGQAEALRHALVPLNGVQVILCRRDLSRFDIFAQHPTRVAKADALLRFIGAMGVESRAPAPALATGLDRRSAQILLGRFADCGIIAVNQAFQRYDLCVTGLGHLTLRELQDFLATRGAPAAASLRQITAGAGFRAETGLSRPLVQQFLADYAAIGIPCRAELVLH